MVCKVICGSVRGIEPLEVFVEVDISRGLPSFSIVGLADTGIKESAERVRSAMENSRCFFPRDRITVNLSPAGFRKKGSQFDLPMAMGILGASGQIDRKLIENVGFIGELSLDGRLAACEGVIQIVSLLKARGVEKIIVPLENLKEAALVPGIEVYGAEDMDQVMDYFTSNGFLKKGSFSGKVTENQENCQFPKDFSEVRGQEVTKRAITIAIAGGHNLFMTGSPGSGKTMLAERVPYICPDMTYEEMLEVTAIYSAAGQLDSKEPLVTGRPFRMAGPRTTAAGLLGGGVQVMPGEFTLAHRGVLFMDELCEFSPSVIEALRVPLDRREILLRRSGEDYRLPADVILIASTNPCPCGYYGDPDHECTCRPYEIQRYRSKLSGPVKDRIDMHIDVPPVRYSQFKDGKSTSSAEMKSLIVKARNIQKERYAGEKIKLNGRLDNRMVKKYCRLDKEGKAFMEEAYSSLKMNPRSMFKIMKLARTCADLDGRDDIKICDIMEAVQYREKVR